MTIIHNLAPPLQRRENIWKTYPVKNIGLRRVYKAHKIAFTVSTIIALIAVTVSVIIMSHTF